MTSDKTFEVHVPDFGQLSDEEIAARLVWFDGAWHPQTKEAMRRFKSNTLDLNLNWANEAYLWSCPICKRSKADLFRVTKAGHLKATLEVHHDHLRDFYECELVTQLGKDWSQRTSGEQSHLKYLVSRLIERFHETLVCSDCNEIDGRIKRILPSIDADFSFSPSETARCIKVAPNASHELLDETAGAIWLAARDDFEDRKAFALSVIEKMKAGGLRKEHMYGPHRGNHLDFTRLQREVMPRSASTFMDETLIQLRLRSISHPDLPDKPPKSRRRRVVIPTDADIAHIVGAGAGTYKWRACPEDWSCPVCARSKREVVRKSKAGAWYAAVFTHTECCIRPGFDDGEIKTNDAVEHHHTFDICGDCSNIVPELRRWKTEQRVHKSFLSADQLREVIEAKPHQAHEIDWKRAALFATENSKWNSTIDEYWPEYRRAVYIKNAFDELQEQFTGSQDDTVEILASRLRSEYPADWLPIEVVEDLLFALESAKKWLSHRSSSYASNFDS